jgi:hypothetical protein
MSLSVQPKQQAEKPAQKQARREPPPGHSDFSDSIPF